MLSDQYLVRILSTSISTLLLLYSSSTARLDAESSASTLDLLKADSTAMSASNLDLLKALSVYA